MAKLPVTFTAAASVPVQPWIAATTRQPFVATGGDLSEYVYVAQLQEDGQAWRSLRARQEADRRGWVAGGRPLLWEPTHWAPVPEIERKLTSMLASTPSPSLRLPDFTFSMDVALDARGVPRGDGPGVVTVKAPGGMPIGRISGGVLRLAQRCDPGLVERVLQAAREPMPEALRYARYSAACCFCGRPLTDPESRRLGIGPTCRGYASGGRKK